MRIFLNFFIFVNLMLSTQAFGQTNPEQRTCSAERTLNRVFDAIHKHVCMNLFYRGPTSHTNSGGILGADGDVTFANLKCAGVIAGAGLASVIAVGPAINGSFRAGMQSINLRYGKEFARLDQAAINKYVNAIVAERRFDRIFSAGMRFSSAAIGSSVFLLATTVLTPSPAGCSEIIHMYTDVGPSCEYKPELGPNTQRFLALPSSEQSSIMAENPQMCSRYTQLAETLENELHSNYPDPEVNISACSPQGSLQRGTFTFSSGPYPAGRGRFDIARIGPNKLRIIPAGRNVTYYEVDTVGGQFGAESVQNIRAFVRGSTNGTMRPPNTHISVDVPAARIPVANGREQVYAQEVLRALHGFQAADQGIGNRCRVTQPGEAGPEAPAAPVNQ